VNGSWLLTASKDQTCRLFDLRRVDQCVLELVGQAKDVSALAWHPTHERLVASGGSDGSLAFWAVGAGGSGSGGGGGDEEDENDAFGFAPSSNGGGGGWRVSGGKSGPAQIGPQMLIKPEDNDVNPMTGQVRGFFFILGL
jgi:WD40 repeat protein